MSILFHFRRDGETSGFRKLVVNKWICRKSSGYFHEKSCNLNFLHCQLLKIIKTFNLM